MSVDTEIDQTTEPAVDESAIPAEYMKALESMNDSEPVNETKAEAAEDPGTEVADTTEVTSEPATKEPEAPTYPVDLVRRALALGVDQADIEGFGTPAAAERAITLLEKREQARQQSVPTKTPQAEEAKASDIPPPLDPEMYEPELVARDKWMQDKVTRLEQQLAQREEAEQEARINQETEWLDDQFSKLPDPIVAVLGKGRFKDLLPDSRDMALRAEVVGTFAAIVQNNPHLKSEDAFLRAARSVLHDEFQKLSLDSAKQQLLKQNAKTLGTSAHTKAVPKNYSGELEHDPELIAAYEEMEKQAAEA